MSRIETRQIVLAPLQKINPLFIKDEEKGVDLVYLDFQKAFDKAPHQRLMKKLEAHGIQADIYDVSGHGLWLGISE